MISPLTFFVLRPVLWLSSEPERVGTGSMGRLTVVYDMDYYLYSAYASTSETWLPYIIDTVYLYDKIFYSWEGERPETIQRISSTGSLTIRTSHWLPTHSKSVKLHDMELGALRYRIHFKIHDVYPGRSSSGTVLLPTICQSMCQSHVSEERVHSWKDSTRLLRSPSTMFLLVCMKPRKNMRNVTD